MINYNEKNPFQVVVNKQLFETVITPVLPKSPYLDIQSCRIDIKNVPVDILRATSFVKHVLNCFRSLSRRQLIDSDSSFGLVLWFPGHIQPDTLSPQFFVDTTIKRCDGRRYYAADDFRNELANIAVSDMFQDVEYENLYAFVPIRYVSSYYKVLRDEYVKAYNQLRKYESEELSFEFNF